MRVLYAAYSQEAVHTVLDEGAATMQALERASPGAAGGDGVLQTVSAGLVTSANVFLAQQRRRVRWTSSGAGAGRPVRLRVKALLTTPLVEATCFDGSALRSRSVCSDACVDGGNGGAQSRCGRGRPSDGLRWRTAGAASSEASSLAAVMVGAKRVSVVLLQQSVAAGVGAPTRPMASVGGGGDGA